MNTNKFKKLEKQLYKKLEEKGSIIKNDKFITYRTILHEGDLPGDQCLQWWTQEDWDRHAKHVKELKAKGTYGKSWICELTLKYFPKYDDPQPILHNKPLESYRMVILDLSKKTHITIS